MSNMFESYQDATLTPNNIIRNCKPCNPSLKPIIPEKPYEQYNANGELVGYYWYYGDTINLQFDIDGEVTDVDGESYISPSDYLSDKTLQFTLYNFRQEQIYVVKSNDYTSNEDGTVTITFAINSELSQQLIRGIYYCSLAVLQDDILQITLIDPEDCIFTVK